MAHLTLQLGAALVVPFDAPRRMTTHGSHWRVRALRATAAAALDNWGWPDDIAPSLPPRLSASGPDRAPGGSES